MTFPTEYDGLRTLAEENGWDICEPFPTCDDRSNITIYRRTRCASVAVSFNAYGAVNFALQDGEWLDLAGIREALRTTSKIEYGPFTVKFYDAKDGQYVGSRIYATSEYSEAVEYALSKLRYHADTYVRAEVSRGMWDGLEFAGVDVLSQWTTADAQA